MQEQKKRKIPIRRCIGCGEHKEKRSLLRVVRAPEDEGRIIALDATGKKNGRGAYVCSDAECLKKAKKRNALSHAFKCRVAEEIYAQLEQQLINIQLTNTPGLEEQLENHT